MMRPKDKKPMAESNNKGIETAFEKLKKLYLEEHGKEMSDKEAEDIRFLAQTLAEIAYESWIIEKKNLAESKKAIPKPRPP